MYVVETHPQEKSILIQGDNKTSVGFENQTIKQKRSKEIDMKIHWIKDRIRQGQFLVYEIPGENNLSD